MTPEQLRWALVDHLDCHGRHHQTPDTTRRALQVLRELLAEDDEIVGRILARLDRDKRMRSAFDA